MLSNAMRFVLVAMTAIAGAGCAAAAVGAAAGAGTAGAIAMTDKGSETMVSADHAETVEATRRAYGDLGIHVEEGEFSTEDEGLDTQLVTELKGKTGDGETEVTAEVTAESDEMTKVSVTARESLVDWNPDLARRVVERIVEITSG